MRRSFSTWRTPPRPVLRCAIVCHLSVFDRECASCALIPTPAGAVHPAPAHHRAVLPVRCPCICTPFAKLCSAYAFLCVHRAARARCCAWWMSAPCCALCYHVRRALASPRFLCPSGRPTSATKARDAYTYTHTWSERVSSTTVYVRRRQWVLCQ